MSGQVYSPSEIDLSLIEFSAPVALKSGGSVVSIKYKGNPLRIQTPSLKMPYGLSTGYVPKGGTRSGPPKYSVGFSFGGAEDNKAIQELKDFFDAFDDLVVKAGCDNSAKWLKKQSVNIDTARALYTSVVKYSKEADGVTLKPYPPTFNATIRQTKEASGTDSTLSQFDIDLYNPEVRDAVSGRITKFGSEMELTQLLCKSGYATNIIEPAGVWLIKGNFNVTFRLIQSRIDRLAESLSGPAFKDDSPDIRAHYSSHQQSQLAHESPEDDDVVVPAPVPAPAPAPEHAAFEDEAVTEPIPVPKKIIKKVIAKSAGVAKA